MRWSLTVFAVLFVGCGAGNEAPVDVVPAPTVQTHSLDSSPRELSGATRWAQRLTGPSEEVAADVAHDGDGNFFIAATFEGKLSDAKGTLGKSATRASVLAKYRPNGQQVWARTVPAQVTALATNRARHVLVTGTFEGSIDLGGGPLTLGEFLEGVFLAAFDASGRHVWSVAYPLEFFSFFDARKMLTDSHGNIASRTARPSSSGSRQRAATSGATSNRRTSGSQAASQRTRTTTSTWPEPSSRTCFRQWMSFPS
ncbi:hypothetical protein ACLEPN_08425 [Myxococcus sp. 1LA]